MKLSDSYLNKSYYVATVLQQMDELRKEGFDVQLKKKIFFKGEFFTADLYAENGSEKQIYDFRLEEGQEHPEERDALLNSICESVDAKPVVVEITLPEERQIHFEELDDILFSYLSTTTLLPELQELPGDVSVCGVKVNNILSATLESANISVSGLAKLYISLRYRISEDEEQGFSTSCDSFPMSFTVSLDNNFNCQTFEYEIDLSGFELKKPEEEPRSEENKNYVSKIRFDAEFKMFQDISEALLTMTGSAAALFPNGVSAPPKKGDEEELTLRAEKAAESHGEANKVFMRNAPFMPKNMYRILETVAAQCEGQLLRFNRAYLSDNSVSSEQDIQTGRLQREDISELQASFMEELRSYLESLDVR